MKIKGKKIETVEVEISDYEIEQLVLTGNVHTQVLIRAIRLTYLKNLGFDNDHSIKENGHWEVETEEHGSHSWFSHTELRMATQAEISFMDSLKHLSEALTATKLSNK